MNLREQLLSQAAELGHSLDERVLLELTTEAPEVIGVAVGSLATIAAAELVLELIRAAVAELHAQWPTWRVEDGLVDLAEALRRLDAAYVEATGAVDAGRESLRGSLRKLVEIT